MAETKQTVAETISGLMKKNYDSCVAEIANAGGRPVPSVPSAPSRHPLVAILLEPFTPLFVLALASSLYLKRPDFLLALGIYYATPTVMSYAPQSMKM